jgi:hypothetical protein
VGGSHAEVAAATAVALLISLPVAALLHARIGSAVAAGTFTKATRAGGIFWMGYMLRVAVCAALIPVAVAAASGKRRGIFLSAVYAVAASFAVFLLWPKKIVIANQLLGILVCLHYLRRQLSLRMLVLAGLAGLLMLPILSAFRYWGLVGLSPAKLSELWSVAWHDPSYIIKPLLLRSFGADSLVLIIDSLRHGRAFDFGSSFLEATRFFVPRALWPNKPPTYAIAFGQEFLARTSFFSVNVSGTPTIIGELLLNFGIVGVIVGGWVTGVFLRSVYEYLIGISANIASVLIYAVFLAGTVMLVEGPIEPQVMDMSVSVTLVIMLLLIMELRKHIGLTWSRARARPVGLDSTLHESSPQP